MKKMAFLISVLFVMNNPISAQFLVEESGNTAVGVEYDSNNSLQSQFCINSRGDNSSLMHINANPSDRGLFIQKYGYLGDGPYNTGMKVYVDVCDGLRNIGAEINTDNKYTQEYNRGFSMGAKLQAGGFLNGKNFGVCTSLKRYYDGAGLYASNGTNPFGIAMDRGWAGYFDGDVNVSGVFFATYVNTTSDLRLKENVEPVKDGSLADVMRMNAVQYNFKQRTVESVADDTIPHYAFDENSPILTKRHYGLIAQELQELYPDLVNEGSDGYLAINYTEIIPILIKSIQELNDKVTTLSEKAIASPTRGSVSAEGIDTSMAPQMETVLFQNRPNPFDETTEIECAVASTVSEAALFIYDANGKQLDRFPILERGNISLTIEGYSLDAGIYLYSLIADGQVIDTKRMILTR